MNLHLGCRPGCIGRIRDSVLFSVTDADWPQVRRALELWLDAA